MGGGGRCVVLGVGEVGGVGLDQLFGMAAGSVQGVARAWYFDMLHSTWHLRYFVARWGVCWASVGISGNLSGVGDRSV